MNQEIQLFEAIHTRGGRLTRQRRLVFEILMDSHEHLDAEALFERAKERDPNISLATVYRSLAILKEYGLVEEHRLGENHGHFETIQECPHYHFTCQECGQVIEMKTKQLEKYLRDLCEADGLLLSSISLNISGLCSVCQRRSDDTTE